MDMMSPFLSKDDLLTNFKLFKGMYSLDSVYFNENQVNEAVDMFNLDFTSLYDFLVLEYGHNCIYAGCLVYCLLKVKLISLGTETSESKKHPVCNSINEWFALFNAMKILNIKQSYLLGADKNYPDKLVDILADRSVQSDFTVEFVIKEMATLCSLVPSYLQ